MAAGYDQTMEDRLFDRIGWPAEGHRLFDIGHFIGERDWFDGLWESNCLFTPRQLVEQSGGFDEIFDMPGGGYANLDIYERLGSTPGVTVATILGEGSFHQFHHGTTTNQDEVESRHRLISSYAEHYEAERGKVFAASGKHIHYVGRLFEGATRTRSRRFVARAFWTPQSTEGRDGVPDEPQPMPQEVAMAFTEAFWHSLAWKETTWLGEAVPAAPTDLVVYQELLSRVRPDWVVITSGGGAGIASFVASICDLLDHGRVLVVGDDGARSHPRVERVGGRPADDATRQAVAERVGDGSALVILGGPKHRDHTIGEFKAYAPLVPVGSYVVVEQSVVNGAPVWPGFGPGPQEAIRLLKQDHPEFMSDLEVQRYALTLNANGFLKRVR
jgi:cephalosporin hydroxylase